MLVEFKSLAFNTLYIWTATFLAPFVLRFHDFLVVFFASS
jgi:hypothetical protein